MKTIFLLATPVVLACSQGYAGEATVGDIDIFFSHDDVIEHRLPSAPAFMPEPYPTRIYIWANIDLNDGISFNGLGLEFVAPDAQVIGGELYNPNMGTETDRRYRWQNGATGSSYPYDPIPINAHGELNAMAIWSSYFELLYLGAPPAHGDYAAGADGDQLAYSHYESATDTWTGSYLLGHIDVQWWQVPGPLNCAVSPAWITQRYDSEPWATVAFGVNVPISGRVSHNIAPYAIPDAWAGGGGVR